MSNAIDAPASSGGVENRVVDGFISPFGNGDSEEIVTQYDLGLPSKRIDFLEPSKSVSG